MSTGKIFGIALLAAACFGFGCDPYPRDPEETTTRVENSRTVHIGVADRPPWTHTEDAVGGIEVDLMREFATQAGLDVEWSTMSETELAAALESGEVHIGIAGYVKSSPWGKHVGFSRPFAEVDGKKHVIAVRRGENRWLMKIEDFLADKEPIVQRALHDAHATAMAGGSR